MTQKFDKQAIFEWLQNSAQKVQAGVEKSIQKTQDISEFVNRKIDDNPHLKSARDRIITFAHDKSQQFGDFRIAGTRISDLPNAAQRLTERQVFKLIMKLRDADPDFNWNQFIPNPEQMPIFAAFETLGLPYGTPFEEVKKTYRRLMRENHPDKHAGSPKAEQAATVKTQELAAAYDLISKHYGK